MFLATDTDETKKNPAKKVECRYDRELYSIFVLYPQGEALRQSLLTRFYGRSQVRSRRDSNEGGGGGGGAVVLSRTELTLHDVQVNKIEINQFELLIFS